MYCLLHFLPLILLPIPVAPPLFLILFGVSFLLHARPCAYCLSFIVIISLAFVHLRSDEDNIIATTPLGDVIQTNSTGFPGQNHTAVTLQQQMSSDGAPMTHDDSAVDDLWQTWTDYFIKPLPQLAAPPNGWWAVPDSLRDCPLAIDLDKWLGIPIKFDCGWSTPAIHAGRSRESIASAYSEKAS